ncbi:uncharacterized protein MELLADRAFT_87799 [Melampsora larici-populina 98AG31]|uniref:Uncharacterized protein n=1 Tax=Melampsora larici-populina (strain 98AG31 / pathotype 3-4-7) TaxID=747676 RepID=F4RPI4_MELLP|nr:uncharacterized protein MELLADRAFT_87799 [Melampsora larici-populina 98AG31]EGG05715.1 hypothetical protein MELLADRAFT_87799 [Melampsora larici-populina 98AG31]
MVSIYTLTLSSLDHPTYQIMFSTHQPPTSQSTGDPSMAPGSKTVLPNTIAPPTFVREIVPSQCLPPPPRPPYHPYNPYMLPVPDYWPPHPHPDFSYHHDTSANEAISEDPHRFPNSHNWRYYQPQPYPYMYHPPPSHHGQYPSSFRPSTHHLTHITPQSRTSEVEQPATPSTNSSITPADDVVPNLTSNLNQDPIVPNHDPKVPAQDPIVPIEDPIVQIQDPIVQIQDPIVPAVVIQNLTEAEKDIDDEEEEYIDIQAERDEDWPPIGWSFHLA